MLRVIQVTCCAGPRLHFWPLLQGYHRLHQACIMHLHLSKAMAYMMSFLFTRPIFVKSPCQVLAVRANDPCLNTYSRYFNHTKCSAAFASPFGVLFEQDCQVKPYIHPAGAMPRSTPAMHFNLAILPRLRMPGCSFCNHTPVYFSIIH